jgi:hypothetical protein
LPQCCIQLGACFHIPLGRKRWSLKLRYFKHVHLRQFDTDCFEILTQRCIRIRACLYMGMESISGWEAVEPQSQKLLYRLLPHLDTLRSNTQVCVHTHIYTRKQLGRKRWSLNLRNFFTDCFPIWTRCVPTPKCVHTYIHTQTTGEEAVEPQTSSVKNQYISETSTPIALKL